MELFYNILRCYLKWVQMLFIALFSLSLVINISYGSDFPKHTLDFIYINSSVDESAGGHVAVRFDQTVFHYQYHSNGFFLIVKENWPEFRYVYNDLQNRTLSVARLPLSSESYLKIKTQFLTRYLLQKKRFLHLEQLSSESVFFQNILSSDCTIPINGLGFFSPKQKDDSMAVLLRASIERRFGPSYIEDLQQKLECRLNRMSEHLQPTLPVRGKLSLYALSNIFSSNINEYFELRELKEALCVLAEARPVVEDVLVHSSMELGVLSGPELERLRQYRTRVRDSILRILSSSRPDKGSALLVQMARYQAISKALESGYLITLDPFSEKAEFVTVESLMSLSLAVSNSIEDKARSLGVEVGMTPSNTRSYFEQLRIERLQDAQNAKDYFFSTIENEDIFFNQLEASLGRLCEINNAENNEGMVRIEGGVLLPSKIAKVSEVLPLSNKETLLQNIALSKANKIIFKRQLYEVYGYNLFMRNCVTEVFDTVYSCFLTNEQAEEELGGYLNSSAGLTFIPFYAFYSIQDKFPRSSIELFPSYRKRQQNRLYKQNGVWSLLKESNTFTSTVYFPWEQDSPFLFFTDDVILTRPLLGAGNVLFATMNAIGGVLWIPVDEGTWLRRSVRGVVFSLPELVFFNIRKGTFPAIAFENVTIKSLKRE